MFTHDHTCTPLSPALFTIQNTQMVTRFRKWEMDQHAGLGTSPVHSKSPLAAQARSHSPTRSHSQSPLRAFSYPDNIGGAGAGAVGAGAGAYGISGGRIVGDVAGCVCAVWRWL